MKIYRVELPDGDFIETVVPDPIAKAGEVLVRVCSRTHLINILGREFCESGVAQGVSADWYDRPLGSNRRTVAVVGTCLASIAAQG